MDIYDKCSLIEEFIREYGKYEYSSSNDEYIDFLFYNDLGVPLAQSVTYNLAMLNSEGEELIKETWINLCNMVETDPDGEYESIYDMGYTEKDE